MLVLLQQYLWQMHLHLFIGYPYRMLCLGISLITVLQLARACFGTNYRCVELIILNVVDYVHYVD